VTNYSNDGSGTQTKAIEGFTNNMVSTVWFILNSSDVNQAIAREKEIKGWLRKRKLELIEAGNPEWTDLSVSWTENTLDSRRAQNDRIGHRLPERVILSNAKDPCPRDLSPSAHDWILRSAPE